MKASDKHKLIDRIKTLEGLSHDERSALLGLLNETKTYGLVWEDKPEVEKSVQIDPCRRKKIDPLVKIRLTPEKSWRRGSI